MKQNVLAKIESILLLCVGTMLCQAQSYSPKVTAAIAQSPFGAARWTKLLEKYRKEDREKYEAACFLLSNMARHYHGYVVESVDTTMLRCLSEADAQYYALVAMRNDTALFNPHFNDRILAPADQQYRKATEGRKFQAPRVRWEEESDLAFISPEFLEEHIDHAFSVRRRSPFARRLSFDDFKNYVLPYRAMENTAAEAAPVYAQRYEKYLHVDTTQQIHRVVWRYNLTAKRLRYWGGNYPFVAPCGSSEMGFLSNSSCASHVDRAVLALRACGIPAAVEYNIAYKIWEGRHYHVSVPTERGWETFNPEESMPEFRQQGFRAALNVYRLSFAEQADAPFALRERYESIPEGLSSPFLQDVTKEVASVVSLRLPFEGQTSHRLAYLATFRTSDYGVLPVTWGEIDKDKREVNFRNVVPDHLYFPVVLDDEGEMHNFAAPFYVKSEKNKEGYSIHSFSPTAAQKVVGQLKRTAPRSVEERKAARYAVGTYVIASDDEHFKVADTLGIIHEEPLPRWQDLPLSTQRPYRYYRVCGAKAHPNVYLSEFAFLSDCDTTEYTTYAPYNELLSPQENARWRQLWDAPVKDCTWKAEYDGSPETAPDRWPDVTLRLPAAKRVNRLRYMGKYERRRVEVGDGYVLFAWDDGYWKREKELFAAEETLRCEDLQVGKLYWLKPKEGKQASQPFFVDQRGEQHFPLDEAEWAIAP